MRKYNKPMIEETLVVTNDILEGSGIELNNTNAGFDITDEVL